LAKASKDADGTVSSSLIGLPYFTEERYHENFNPSSKPDLHKHIREALAKSILLFAPFEVKPFNDTTPFNAPITARYRIGIPTIPGKNRATARWHFETRPGVTVSVTPVSSYEVDVQVTLNPDAYAPPPAPNCSSISALPDRIDELGHFSKGTTSG